MENDLHALPQCCMSLFSESVAAEVHISGSMCRAGTRMKGRSSVRLQYCSHNVVTDSRRASRKACITGGLN